jgi:hypothetical protein
MSSGVIPIRTVRSTPGVVHPSSTFHHANIKSKARYVTPVIGFQLRLFCSVSEQLCGKDAPPSV